MRLRLHLQKLFVLTFMPKASMRKLLPQKTISYLNPNEDMSQFQRSRSFMDGLTQASEAFRSSFKITARGIGKSKWADSQETLALVRPLLIALVLSCAKAMNCTYGFPI